MAAAEVSPPRAPRDLACAVSLPAATAGAFALQQQQVHGTKQSPGVGQLLAP